MVRSIALFSALIALIPMAQADEKARTTPKAGEEAAQKQEAMARRFRDFEQALLHLTQRLEQSSRLEDREKATTLRKAVELAGKEGTDLKFEKLIQLLKTSRALDGNLNDLEEVLRQNKMVAEDIKAILKLLLDDDRLAKLRAEAEWFGDILRELERLIRDEKKIRARLDAGKGELAKEQEGVTKDTRRLAEIIRKRYKDDAPPTKHVDHAVDHEQNASKQLGDGKPGDASHELDKAIEDLENARRFFRDQHDHAHHAHRDLLREKLLAYLGRMLTLQTEVRAATVKLDMEAAGEKLTRPQQQQALKLSDQEAKVHDEAKGLLNLLRDEGSAIVFAEVAKQVRDDIVVVENRLNRADVGNLTQKIETDVVDTIKEMIAALKKQQAAAAPPPPFPPGDGPTMTPPLIDYVTELKTIRFMQVRVNERTQSYATQYEGEQANNADVSKELRGLAGRQRKIIDMTKELPRK
jgi:hypothetical protein